ncbi:glycoside hydrolase family 2 protein [Thermothelomyces thermophilus ATCC 42464]|uniref:Beta-mannosidase B n=1 Tax=Thermothelomyces thermophilus (strain ATCC 42464 / BCRC 31852 / DSM 1799) TaxID=573729 RepID=G2QFF8_THET4|nr:glycoside hydrolase family 2 protein [Thermothelomyces thermophilus ATCC 42464]AEO59187.1 glycoside hydrolase family 2 protein [Thermothelomyces thermophilus ATCC 42464]
MTQHTARVLSSGWEFKSDADEKWLPVSGSPSNVHTDLMRHGLIPDPFQDTNELEVRWVAERTWRYRTSFATPSCYGRARGVRVDLVFEGLDTFATVTLNGQVILRSDNMFLEHRVDVGDVLVDGAEEESINTLEIAFEPAGRRGLELVRAHPEHEFIVHQTEVSRGPVRKAQYHWGWDWGPILLTCGPWKPVRLETYVGRIEDVRVDYEICSTGRAEGDGRPIVEATVHAHVLGPAAELEAELLLSGERVASWRDRMGDDAAAGGPPPSSSSSSRRYSSPRLRIERAELWWPRGYGPQSLYELKLRILAADGLTVLAEEHRRIGFRKVELIREEDRFGQSFYFRVNGVDVFSGGSCWVPADSFLPEISPERYRDWIRLVAEGNQNMVRVWGGGVYEPDVFYAACDELGIMVWQDFMFACASYPTYPAFLDSVAREARQAVRRLRHHPCVVLWCGNNEDYQLVERYGLEYRFEEDRDPASWLRSTFPARYIYEHLLPGVVRDENPAGAGATPYHPGSPWGDGRSTTLRVDPTVGDVHQWELWNGEARPWQLLPRMGGRFVSEFGMLSHPHADTVARFVSDPAERRAGSRTMDFHTKAVAHERRLLAYVGENFGVARAAGGGGAGAFAHLTQVVQADAVAAAYRSWRRHWGRPGERRCGGVLVWQLNDCWPAVSWAVVDYYLVRKPAFYAIRRALAPLAVGVARKFHDWTTRPADALWRRNTGHVDPRGMLTDVEFDVWVSSSRSDAVRARAVVRFVSVRSGREVGDRIEREVQVGPNGCTELLVGYKFDWRTAAVAEPEHFVIHVALWVGGVQVSSDTSWPDPIKYLDFPDRGVSVRHLGPGLVEVSAQRPVKGFVFSEKRGVKLSDNGFDLVPGDEPKRVEVQGCEVDELSWTFVGQ